MIGMSINWKLRFQNKATLTALALTIVAFVYQMFGVLGVVPSVSQNDIVNLVGLIINILVGFGVVIDPTTSGISDSNRAMAYDKPNTDTVE